MQCPSVEDVLTAPVKHHPLESILDITKNDNKLILNLKHANCFELYHVNLGTHYKQQKAPREVDSSVVQEILPLL
jgi:hypothetical protein